MKQKIAYMAIGVIFTVILSFTWLSYASQSSEIEGQLTMIDPERQAFALDDGKKSWEFSLDSNAIIYKNNERATLSELDLDDEAKVLLNSNKQVRYVVAASEKETADAVVDKPVVKSVTSDETRSNVEKRSEASFVAESEIERPAHPERAIREFELEIERKRDHKIEVKYENKDGKIKWEQENIDIPTSAESFMTELALSPEMNKQEMAQRVLDALQEDMNFKKFELEVKFANGKEIEIEIKNDGKPKTKYKEKYKDDDDDDDDDDD